MFGTRVIPVMTAPIGLLGSNRATCANCLTRAIARAGYGPVHATSGSRRQRDAVRPAGFAVSGIPQSAGQSGPGRTGPSVRADLEAEKRAVHRPRAPPRPAPPGMNPESVGGA